jgi:exosortase
MDTTQPQRLWQPLLIACAVAFAYAIVFPRLGLFWWTDENYSHGLLVPFIIGYVLWSERSALQRAPKSPAPRAGLALVIVGLLMLWIGTAGAELFTQRTSLVVVVAGLVTYFWGFRLVRLVAVPLLLFLLAVPIPAIVFNKIAFPLQLFASRCAVASMQLLDIPVLRQGNVIELMPLGSSTTKKLEVVEACSGIRSLMTLVTLAVVFAYFTYPKNEGQGDGTNGKGDGARRRFAWLKSYGTWRSIILVVSAVPIAIITNAGRVSGTGILSRYYGTRVADGFFHEFSGWVVYIVAFLLLFSLGSLLDLFGNRKARRARRAAIKSKKARTDARDAYDSEVTLKRQEETDEPQIVNAVAPVATVTHGADGA